MNRDSELAESEFNAKYFSKKENEKFKDILGYLRKLEMHASKDLRNRHETINVLEKILSEQIARCSEGQILHQEARIDFQRKENFDNLSHVYNII